DMSQASRIELHFDFGASKASQEEIAKAKQLGLPVRPPRILFVKQPNGNWQLQEPVVRTDFNSTNYLATTIGGGQMNSVEEEKTDSLAKYKLDRPQIRVDVTTPGGVQSLIVGGEKKVGEQQFFYAKNSVWPHIFTILRTVYDQLNQDYEAYRNRYVFDFETASAKRVEILGPTGELRFERKNNKWMRAGSPEKEMEDQKFEGFLDSIHNLRIAAYPTDAPGHFAQYGLEKPWLKIKVTFGEKNQEETVVFGRANKKFYA